MQLVKHLWGRYRTCTNIFCSLSLALTLVTVVCFFWRGTAAVRDATIAGQNPSTPQPVQLLVLQKIAK